MELVLGIVLVVVALYLILSNNKKGKTKGQWVSNRSPKTPAQLSDAHPSVAVFNEHKAWLSSRWAEANRHNDDGDTKTFPSWFFDAATERQLNLLKEKDLSLSGGQLSRGQASDVIGLFFPVEEADKEVLRFFKVPTKGLNQTTARAEVAMTCPFH
jgi:hypothetical protein